MPLIVIAVSICLLFFSFCFAFILILRTNKILIDKNNVISSMQKEVADAKGSGSDYDEAVRQMRNKTEELNKKHREAIEELEAEWSKKLEEAHIEKEKLERGKRELEAGAGNSGGALSDEGTGAALKSLADNGANGGDIPDDKIASYENTITQLQNRIVALREEFVSKVSKLSEQNVAYKKQLSELKKENNTGNGSGDVLPMGEVQGGSEQGERREDPDDTKKKEASEEEKSPEEVKEEAVKAEEPLEEVKEEAVKPEKTPGGSKRVRDLTL